MRVLLPPDCSATLRTALESAGTREAGGVLMGEHVGRDVFRVRTLTVQRGGGSFAAFVRVVAEIVAPLAAFFRDTGHNYRRFNYLGEWHSHPSFSLAPSSKDIQTMRDIVDDPSVGASFAVLLIVKLAASGDLQGAAFVFPARQEHHAATVEVET